LSPQARAFLETQGIASSAPASPAPPKAIPQAPPAPTCLTNGETPRKRRPRSPAPRPGPNFYKLGNASPYELARQLRRLRNRKAVAAIRVAAFSGRRGWHSAVACGVIRHALALLMVADQRGVVRDVPINLLRKAHNRRATGKLPHRDTIGSGLHHQDATIEDGQAGYARLLQWGGFLVARKQYRKRDPSRPHIAPSCNWYQVCEAEVPLHECTTDEQCAATLRIVELATIPHPSSGISPRAPPSG